MQGLKLEDVLIQVRTYLGVFNRERLDLFIGEGFPLSL